MCPEHDNHQPCAKLVPAQELPNYQINSFDAGDDDIQVRIKQNGVRFILYASPNRFHSSASETARFWTIWKMIDENKTHEAEVWEYLAHIIEPFVPRIDALAPFVEPSGKLTMADLHTGRCYDLVLEAGDNKLGIGSVEESPPAEDYDDDDMSLPSNEDICFAKGLNAPFPILGLSDVEIPIDDPKLVFAVTPNKVVVDGHQYYFRACRYYDISSREVAKHAIIAESGLSADELRCVRLFAVVEDKEGYIHGLLYHWIEHEQSLSFAVTDSGGQATDSMDQRRGKWAEQVQNTVTKLHSLGIIWGDVKAGNVLIDGKDDAWVIDLEGGYSRGWIDPENEGTLKGDEQGMEKLMDYIFNDDCPLRDRSDDDSMMDDYSDRSQQE